MRFATIWQVSVSDLEMGHVLFWGRTKSEAMAAAQEYIAANDATIGQATKHRIELSSAGFSRWLSIWFTHDNG